MIGASTRYLEMPVGFFLALAPLFFLVQGLLGFSGAILVAAYFVFLLWYRFRQTNSWDEFFLYGVTFLLLFDSPTFTFTPFKLRLWYPLLALAGLLILLERRKSNLTFPVVSSAVGGYVFFYYVTMSSLWLFWDDWDGKLSNLKYLFLAAGLMLFYRSLWFRLSMLQCQAFLRYLATLSIFVSLWGLLQVFFNTFTLFGPLFQRDSYNLRPSAFFSETTWYAEFCLFGILLVIYLINRRLVKPQWVLFLLPLLISLVVSNTRNAFVGLAVAIIGLIFLSLFRRRREPVPLWNRWSVGLLLATTLGLVLASLVAWPEVVAQAQRIVQRFTGNDASGQSRLEAFARSWKELETGWFTGQGYTWHPDQGTAAGTVTGSKSFNLVFMITYIFGWSGLAVLAVGIIAFIRSAVSNYLRYDWLAAKYALVLFAAYFVMSMFTPIHQYPFGLMVFALATVLHRRADA